MGYYEQAKAEFLAGHQHPVNQALHHLNALLVLVSFGLVFYSWVWAIAILALTQVIALIGHWGFEKSQLTTMKYPGITIWLSLAWSFQEGFGLKALLNHHKPAKERSL